MNMTQRLDGRRRLLVVDRETYSTCYRQEHGERQLIEFTPPGSGYAGLVIHLISKAVKYEALTLPADLVARRAEGESSALQIGFELDGVFLLTDAIPGRRMIPNGAMTTGGVAAADAVQRIVDELHPVLAMLERIGPAESSHPTNPNASEATR